MADSAGTAGSSRLPLGGPGRTGGSRRAHQSSPPSSWEIAESGRRAGSLVSPVSRLCAGHAQIWRRHHGSRFRAKVHPHAQARLSTRGRKFGDVYVSRRDPGPPGRSETPRHTHAAHGYPASPSPARRLPVCGGRPGVRAASRPRVPARRVGAGARRSRGGPGDRRHVTVFAVSSTKRQDLSLRAWAIQRQDVIQLRGSRERPGVVIVIARKVPPAGDGLQPLIRPARTLLESTCDLQV